MSGIQKTRQLFTAMRPKLGNIGKMSSSNLGKTHSTQMRGISTQQHAKFVGNKEFQGKMQPMNLCHLNIQSFVKTNSPLDKSGIQEDQFMSLDDIKDVFKKGGVVGARLDGIADTGSVYGPNNHSVALVDIVSHKGKDHFLIFDGDHTQTPETQKAMEGLAQKLDKEVQDLSLSDLREAGLEHLAFRLEPVTEVMEKSRVEMEENMSGMLESVPKGPFYTAEPQKGFMEMLQDVKKMLLG